MLSIPMRPAQTGWDPGFHPQQTPLKARVLIVPQRSHQGRDRRSGKIDTAHAVFFLQPEYGLQIGWNHVHR